MANKRKTSPIWLVDKATFTRIVTHSCSVADALRVFGLVSKGANPKTLRARMEEEGLDYYALAERGTKVGKTRAAQTRSVSLDELLVRGSTIASTKLKAKLLQAGLLEYKCAACTIEDKWNGKPIVLALHHKNGDGADNRLCNLCLLCPNCHSQTENFAGRNKERGKKHFDLDSILTRVDQLADPGVLIAVAVGSSPTSGKNSQARSECTSGKKDQCKQCGQDFVVKAATQKFCSTACADTGRRRVEHPTKYQLEALVWNYPRSALAKFFRVSGNAIEKWCKQHDIATPGRGYWAKRQAADARPPKDVLEKLTWEMTTQAVADHFNVRKETVIQWRRTLDIVTPPRGYWNTKK